ncbi:MAG: hydrogenase expression/formation protein HypE [bacterium]|nr:hydrogenase expression/formation protein HypE [bacterium]
MIGETVTLAMGAGGALSARLIEEVFLPAYGNEALNRLEDAAEIETGGGRTAFTTDAYTVKPLFFPGGDIGRLAVCGTANDLAAAGARPAAVSAAFVIEEGFPIADLVAIARSMRDAAAEAGARIVAGDTKVVRRGEADGLFIATAGVGRILPGMAVSCRRARPGDAILVSGPVGAHGVAVLNAREALGFIPDPRSDVAPVFDIVERLAPLGGKVHAMRDPTRGGVAAALGEIARASGATVLIREARVPVAADVRACCEILGLDPFTVACEGRLVAVVAGEAADDALARMRAAAGGREAALIGRVEEAPDGGEAPPVRVETVVGGRRFLAVLDGDPVPRIC